MTRPRKQEQNLLLFERAGFMAATTRGAVRKSKSRGLALVASTGASPTADSMLAAFVRRSARDASFVCLAERAPPSGYVRVYGPTANPRDWRTCYVIVERPNGAVCVSEELSGLPGIKDRPNPPLPIALDDGGYAAGPRYGRYRWWLPPSSADSEYDSPDGLVDKIIDELKTRGVPW